MEFDFKKWVKGETPEENTKLARIDSEFGKLIDRLDDEDIDRESIFIYGMFNLLEYLHLRNNDLLHRLTLLLESYIIFVRMRTNYKDYRGLPTDIKITELDIPKRRVNLSIKQADPNWKDVEEKKNAPKTHSSQSEEQQEPKQERQSVEGVDESLENILQELKERGIGNS